MTSINDVLKASKGLSVDDIFAQLWGRKLSSDYTVYTGTLPATLTGTKAGYLQRYKVYGNLSSGQECGERTENLFDSTDFGLVQVTETVYRKGTNLGVLPQGTYTLSATTNNPTQIYRTTKTGDTYNVETVNVLPYSFTADGVSEQIFRTTGTAGDSWADLGYSNIMLNLGSTALPYEPYGYKLPLTSGSTPVDIFLGDDTLSTEEYVDSGTGKIYRMVDGVLTPVDPPIPFPQIPTSAGSTTISWTGEGLAPSQVELTYERK